MDVFVIPIGHDRYELYCETSPPPPDDEPVPNGFFGRMKQRFLAILQTAEERRTKGPSAAHPEPTSWTGRMQERVLAWVAERIAEQRLLWNLRGQTEVVAAHPEDMTFEQVMTLIRRMLQRDYERHRLWLLVDTVLLIASAVLALVPGPNLVAYYFLFRAGGHFLSMRGAAQGLHRATWTGRSCPPLTELRELAILDAGAREARVRDVAHRLRLQDLPSFFERVAVGSA